MAQILKKEIRNRIINAAKEELLVKGYDKSSLRNIAKNSGVSVGNLYHYYESKDVLIESLLSPCLIRLNEIIVFNTDSKVSLLNDIDTLDLSIEDIKKMLNKIIDDLVDIHKDYHDEFMILFLHSGINIKIEKWFRDLINFILSQKQIDVKNSNIHSEISATIFFSAYKRAFELYDEKKFDINRVLKDYTNNLLDLME